MDLYGSEHTTTPSLDRLNLYQSVRDRGTARRALMAIGNASRRASVTRRRFLIAIGGTGLLLALAAGGAGYRLFSTERAVIAGGDRGDGTREALSSREETTLVALAEVLVPRRYWIGPDATRRLIRNAVDEDARLAVIYADAARLLDERGDGRYHDLPTADREAVLDAMFWQFSAEFGETTPAVRGAMRVRGLKRRVERAWLDARKRLLRDVTMADLIERLYLAATPCVIGYENTQGVPGGPRGYVDPPAPARPVCMGDVDGTRS